jgi:bacteriocin biosynthesis cyclodehydratase domain-containing protein
VTIAVVPTGAFGGEVSTFLGGYAHVQEVVRTGTLDEAFDLDSALVVTATWRPSPSLHSRADGLSFERQRPWLPIVMEHWRILIGPLARPPAGPCHQCFARRRAQHDTRYSETVAADRAFSEDQEAGPRGYMPYHARVAASLAIWLVQLAQASSPSLAGPEAVSASKVLEFDLMTSDISVSSVIRCHDCNRCAGRAQPAIAVKEVLSKLCR